MPAPMNHDIFAVLTDLAIPFERIHHPAVYTAEQARRLVPQKNARAAKNLFLRDKKGKRHMLLAVEDHKNVLFKDIEEQIGVKHLSLASPDRLQRYLGVTPGGVSLLALINDHQDRVEVFIDRALWSGERIQAHPLVNTETLILSIEDMAKFIEYTGHAIHFIDA